ncbi:MAG: rRNA maturation RNase YbeY [Candidatus Omnitrophota bacterium]
MSPDRVLTIENLQNKVPVNRSKISKVIFSILRRLRIRKNVRIGVYFVGDGKIKVLNRRYLKHDRSTDVICFDLSMNKKETLADIFISADTAVSNAKKFNTTPGYELCLYAAHGVLHLFGFDDTTRSKRRLMRRKEKEIMTMFFTNPQEASI